MQTRRILLAALACGTLALSSCGSDSEGDALASASASSADDAARAEAALLTLEDVPPGYAVAPPEPEDEEDSGGPGGILGGGPDEPEECEGLDTDSDVDGESADVEFEVETDLSLSSISHEVVHTGEAEALAAVAALKQAEVTECLRAYMLMGAEEEAAGDDTISVDEVDLERDSLDQPADLASFSGRMVMTAPEIPGFSMEAKVHFEFRQVGPFFSSLSYLTIEGETIDFAALNAAIDRRVAAALA